MQVLERLRSTLSARAPLRREFGEVLAFEGEPDIHTSDLGDLAVARLGGIEGVLRQVGQSEAGVLFHEVPGQDVYLTMISDAHTFVVLFDQKMTSLGTVRRHVKAHRDELAVGVESEE